MSTSTTQSDSADDQSATPSDNGYSQTSPRSQSNFSRREVLAGIGVVGSAILAGCGAQKVDDESKSLPVVPNDAWYDESVTGDISLFEKELVRFTNEARREYGIEDLEYSNELSQVARFHSWDMHKRNYFAHVNPEKQSPRDRVLDAGLSIHTVKENIAEFCGGNAPGLETTQAENIIKSWLGSPGHRETLLDSKYTDQGIGVYIGQGGCGHATHLFAQDYMEKL